MRALFVFFCLISTQLSAFATNGNEECCPKLQEYKVLLNFIETEAPECIILKTNDEIYIDSKSIVSTLSGMMIKTEKLGLIPVPLILSDSSGAYLPLPKAAAAIPSECCSCGRRYMYSIAQQKCPSCGSSSRKTVPPSDW